MERLRNGEQVIPEIFASGTIYFSDVVGFVAFVGTNEPMAVVNFLNEVYTVFDTLLSAYAVYKLETIADCYIVSAIHRPVFGTLVQRP